MSPDSSECMERAKKLLAATRKQNSADAPSPEAAEEAALGVALMCILSASTERVPSADRISAMVGVILTIAHHQNDPPEAVASTLLACVARLAPTVDFVNAKGMTPQ